jgi:hypothetical protein
MSVERIHTWVKRRLESMIDPAVKYHICLASAKSATGIQKVIEILEKIKKEYEMG